jgi:hypothetical protein
MSTWRRMGAASLWLGIGALVVLVAGCAGMSGREPVMLTGAQEVPQVSTSGVGSADISVDFYKCPSAASSKDCPTLVGTVTTTGVRDTGVQIREGGPGHTGPIVVRLVRMREHEWVVPPGTALTNAQYTAYQAGQLYVNVDSASHRHGEIRTQLSPG